MLSLELCEVPLIFCYPADHAPDWQPRMVEVRSVYVKITHTHGKERTGSGAGTEMGTRTGTRVEANEGAQDGNEDGGGNRNGDGGGDPWTNTR